ncbi:hypothetical protein NAPIS_ORF01908 [Vairimorpha apis BRL 01]|uniref:Uncharacterized protein n=1 Tax=Vairimorpha apis BRL 01 TaxID=1037528 RepID=T0L7Q7_9MICR|nr:hypothetical protein NAPIS_ORF01908 [Vairimorpha apis BRL 01]
MFKCSDLKNDNEESLENMPYLYKSDYDDFLKTKQNINEQKTLPLKSRDMDNVALELKMLSKNLDTTEEDLINSNLKNINSKTIADLNVKSLETDTELLDIKLNPIKTTSIDLYEVAKDESEVDNSSLNRSTINVSLSESFSANQDINVNIRPEESLEKNPSLNISDQTALSRDVPTSFEQINLLNNEEVLEETYKKLRLYHNNRKTKIIKCSIIILVNILIVVSLFVVFIVLLSLRIINF